VQAATADMAAAEENRRDVLIILWAMSAACMRNYGVPAPARDCKQEYQNSARHP